VMKSHPARAKVAVVGVRSVWMRLVGEVTVLAD